MKTMKGKWLHVLQLTVLILITASASAQLHADFSSNVTMGCPPLVVSFKDSSTGNPTSWKWDLGDGGTPIVVQNPITTFFDPGTYTIKLVIADANGKDSIVKKEYIVVNALPVPKFGVTDSSGCFPLKVSFKDSSLAGSGTISAWQWDFGDGTLSNEQNPTHTYTNAGNFSVVLRVVNTNGCSNVITKPALIKVLNGVKAEFDYSSVKGCQLPSLVNFTNKTVGTGTISYLWDFGDGKKSQEEKPVNQYENAGVYTIKLIATNSFGCTDTLIKNNAINIGKVTSGFSAPESVCAGAPLHFTNTSDPTTYVGSTWSFGDDSTSEKADVSHIFLNPGVFQVKLVTDFGSCLDSVVKPITVLASPVVSFTAENNTGCKAPLEVKFKNTTADGVSYEWNFGDGSTSTLENPVHTYKTRGAYNVTLTVKNATGCTEILIKDSLVRIAPPEIASLNGFPFRGCIPATLYTKATLTDTVEPVSYYWDFGDGSTSTDSTPSHTYTVAGQYDVKLQITSASGCIDTTTARGLVKVGTKPHVEFTADPRDACAYKPITFTDLSTGNPVNDWFWTFGDGGYSSDSMPLHKYTDTGYFNITLVAYNFGCSDTLEKKNYIHITPPIAKFDTAFSCNDRLTRNFIDKSIGATTWSWDFGDGSPASTEQNPSHTYAKPGKYEVTLEVTNTDCHDMITKDVVVIQEQGKLDASVSIGCTNTRIIYSVTNVAPANIGSYTWFFSGITEGSIVTANNPVAAAFNTPGERASAVVLTDILKCRDTIYTPVPIITYGPKAAFSSANAVSCYGNTINFADETTTDGVHPIQSWKWSYGDGNPKEYTAASDFSHNYTDTGTYSVKLVVTDSYACSDSISKPAYISITKVVASFKASDTVICPVSKITFTNKSTGEGVKYNWDFGDGTTTDAVSPLHEYKDPGVYKVKLLVIDKNKCRDSMFTTIKVFTAKADFTLSDNFSSCPPLTVGITNNSSNYVAHSWSFGDGGSSKLVDPAHIYTYPGSYTVTLIVNNNGGCSDTMTRPVRILGPTGTFSYTPKEVCIPGKVSFTIESENSISFLWNFIDGNTITTTTQSATHIYTSPGKYVPKIILKDVTGCPVTITGKDTIKVNTIETHILSSDRLLCDSGYIAFKDSTNSNDAMGSYRWNFGDGDTSIAKTPTHKFTDTGYYDIRLISTSKFGCADTTIEHSYIKVVNSPAVRILGDTSACEPAQLSFQGGFARTDTSKLTWTWDLGNGQVSNLQNPVLQTYAKAGTYPITVKVINSDGCIDAESRKAIIHPKPIVDAGPDTIICRYTSYPLHPTGADTYTWKAHPSLSCTNCTTPVAKPEQLVNTYYVTGKTVFGCINQDSLTVKVLQPFKMSVPNGDTLCIGESINLQVAGADVYQWTPALYLDKTTGATVKSRPDSTITYQVTGKDSIGCFKETGSVKIKVYPKPVIEITNGNSITVQIGSTVKLGTKNSADITKWKWFPGQWLSCATCAEPLISPKDDIAYSVTASNDGNCQATDQITVNVICDNANVFMPNTFSPNGDGMNDRFYPRGTGLYNIRTFKIFNRWGQVIFSRDGISANNPAQGWDGTMNGKEMQTDVYVYLLEVVCANNVVFPFKGNVTLVR